LNNERSIPVSVRHDLLLVCLLVALLPTEGCRSSAEKALDARHERRQLLDDLYAAYGGGSIANWTRADAEQVAKEDAGGAGGAQLAVQVIGEFDRSYFEDYCLAIGRGDRPFTLSEKLVGFVKDPKNASRCRKAAALQAKAASIEGASSR
jgi:hypothetical protein